MKLLIFGASGTIGTLVVEKALHEGFDVKVYIRNPSKLTIIHPKLEIIKGELHDYDKIKNAVSGIDTVISTLGPPVKRYYNGFHVLEGHKNIIRAMKNENVKRFITIATPSVRFEKDIPSLITKLPTIMAKLFLPKAYKEIVEIGNFIVLSGLDWTIVRFVSPNNTKGIGDAKVTFGDKKVKMGISRADIAQFILKEAKENNYIRSMPIIGS